MVISRSTSPRYLTPGSAFCKYARATIPPALWATSRTLLAPVKRQSCLIDSANSSAL